MGLREIFPRSTVSRQKSASGFRLQACRGLFLANVAFGFLKKIANGRVAIGFRAA
jgi:hypothetical protein